MRQEPGSLRQLHWHLEADEWQFGINGTLELYAVTNQGVQLNGTLREGQAGFVPRGAGHYLYNPTSQPAYFAVVFNNAKFSTTTLPGFIGNLPIEVSRRTHMHMHTRVSARLHAV